MILVHSLQGNSAVYIVHPLTPVAFLFRTAFISAWQTETSNMIRWHHVPVFGLGRVSNYQFSNQCCKPTQNFWSKLRKGSITIRRTPLPSILVNYTTFEFLFIIIKVCRQSRKTFLLLYCLFFLISFISFPLSAFCDFSAIFHRISLIIGQLVDNNL